MNIITTLSVWRKLKVTGHLKINGEDKEVTGQAYYNHQWFNISPMEAFHSWVWGRQNSGKYSVLLYDMVGADRFGQPKIPLFTVDDENGKRVIENIDDQHAKVEVLDTYVQEKTGKTYPKELRYTFEDDDVTAEFTIKNPQEINLIDITVWHQRQHKSVLTRLVYNQLTPDTWLKRR